MLDLSESLPQICSQNIVCRVLLFRIFCPKIILLRIKAQLVEIFSQNSKKNFKIRGNLNKYISIKPRTKKSSSYHPVRVAKYISIKPIMKKLYSYHPVRVANLARIFLDKYSKDKVENLYFILVSIIGVINNAVICSKTECNPYSTINCVSVE